MRKYLLTAMFLSVATVLCSCTCDTQSSLIREHELDALIAHAEEMSSDKTDIDWLGEFECLKFELYDEKRGITASADAQITVPETDAVSVYGVRCKKFTQETADIVRRELLGNARLYDGGALEIQTKADIVAELEMLERELSSYANGEYRSETLEKIELCRAEYENAPEMPEIEKYPSDGILSPTTECLKRDGLSEYYEWATSLNPDGEILYAVTDGADGNYSVLYVQNCPTYGNKLVFRTNRVNWEYHDGVIVDGTSFETTDKYESFPENFLAGGLYYSEEPNLISVTESELTITEKEARRLSEELLAKLGFDDFVFYEGGMYSEPLRLDRVDGDYYGTYYILRYLRCLDGVVLSQPNGGKTDWGSENGLGKRQWPVECIELRINDEGIVGLDINAPLEITDVIVDNVKLLSLDKICAAVKNLLPIATASEYYDKNIKIDKVTLCYSRISEEDSFDEGIIIPVWDISGLCEYISGGYVFRESVQNVMVVNALDGSVINNDS